METERQSFGLALQILHKISLLSFANKLWMTKNFSQLQVNDDRKHLCIDTFEQFVSAKAMHY